MIESKILIFGGSGQLGTALLHELRASGNPAHAPPRSEIDLLVDPLESALETLRPTAVINASAYNDVAGAELASGRDAAFRLNRDIPAELSQISARLGIPFVHVSTDYVFDGRKQTPYREDDTVSPLQSYGLSKLEGERAVLQANPVSVVARTSTLYGRGRRDGSNYVDAVLARARVSNALELVRPPVSSPTYAGDLAAALVALMDARATGVVHVVNGGACSRFDLAAEAIRIVGLEGQVRLDERPAPGDGPERPLYSVLDTSRYTEITGKTMRPWRAALREYLAQ